MCSQSLVLSLTLVGVMTLPLLSTAPAQAQAARTWVSGVGSDTNACTRTAPCLTWAGALAKTAAGGEIDALDAGAFGTVTIAQSVTLDGGGGEVASSLAAGTNGITINAGASDIVVLRNLRFQGLRGNGSNPSGAGLSAIVFNSGAELVVDNCDIVGFNQDGISIFGNGFMAVNNTRITNVGHVGILNVGTNAQVEVDNVRIYGSLFGVAISAGNTVVFNRSVSSKAVYAGVEADGGATVFVDNSVLSYNGMGAQVSGGSNYTMANTDVLFNTTGIAGGGTLQSFVNNRLVGNGSTNSPAAIGTTSNPSGQR